MNQPTPNEIELPPDDAAEASMIGELAPLIITKDERGESAHLEMHALEAMNTPTGRALKHAMFIEMGYRRAYHALAAANKLKLAVLIDALSRTSNSKAHKWADDLCLLKQSAFPKAETPGNPSPGA